jgi:ubiquinone/menaquinone biosynthesis C-methylase UbiE
MRLITRDDFIETYGKIYQRGVKYFFSKLSFSMKDRALSTFNEKDIVSSYAWSLLKVRQRWNELITGDKNTFYEDYFVSKYLQGRSGLRLLSLGSGVCSHELRFAAHPCFSEVKCVDFSDVVLSEAAENAAKAGLENLIFEVDDVNNMNIPSKEYDVILFHSSLHHFKNIDVLLKKVKSGLKDNGLLVINEYVGKNRIQLSRAQVKEINRILKHEIPDAFKIRHITGLRKNSFSGPGWLRMIISDPSEAVESERILPQLHLDFIPLEEKNIGGNIVVFLLKDIAHHFDKDTEEAIFLLGKIFELEDEFLQSHPSDMVFGVYKPKR